MSARHQAAAVEPKRLKSNAPSSADAPASLPTACSTKTARGGACHATGAGPTK
eukprot:CAMPEP_0204030908 /NCGR_PEP_ID=MMETSP0360-20130528/60754_1 /ASSEMBLY_ACC=CAM_ASM_000342 /TAXON_ID=268821 /ORGANISM="Scrippsiella Hangoei, Strain SHTV-5" /LENGTH=52 /DNA_ID=CAMNT_0050975063 /DNA_START=17 /DNA_END=172 /DNA_ORIENTATION=-